MWRRTSYFKLFGQGFKKVGRAENMFSFITFTIGC